jgi:hypothetical protein
VLLEQAFFLYEHPFPPAPTILSGPLYFNEDQDGLGETGCVTRSADDHVICVEASSLISSRLMLPRCSLATSRVTP